MEFIKLNDDRIVNVDKVAYIKLVTLDKNEILWDRVDTTGGIEYVLIDNAHMIERYDSYAEAKTAFEALSYSNFKAMENVDVIINKAYLKALKKDIANDLKLDYIIFNGMVQDVFETLAEREEGYADALADITGEQPTPTVESIAITTAPTKVAYNAGETFDPTGMVITATYSDTTSGTVTGYTYAPTAALTTADTTITITYEGKTATQSITVTEQQ